MKYTFNIYLRDSFWLYDKFINILFDINNKCHKYVNYGKNSILQFNIRKNLKYTLPHLPCFFLIIFLGFLSVSTLAVNIEKKNGIRVINLKTGSMRPSIPIATIVITIPQDNYFVGDIITYREVDPKTGLKYSRTYTHRIIEKSQDFVGETFITKGDSNKLPDPGVLRKDDIMGKVIFKIPYLGYLSMLLKTKTGFILLIFLPSLFIFTNEVLYIKKEMELR